MNIDDAALALEPKIANIADAWIFSHLAQLVRESTYALESYRFGDYARIMYEFFWSEFCDWYIEFCKGALNGKTDEAALQTQANLLFVLETAIRLLHPVMPFVTEAIWDNLPNSAENAALMIQPWPLAERYEHFIDENAEKSISLVCDIVTIMRTTRAKYGISPAQELGVKLKLPKADELALQDGSNSDEQNPNDLKEIIENQSMLITKLGKISAFDFLDVDATKPDNCICDLAQGIEVYVEVGDFVNMDELRAKVQKDLDKARSEIAKLDKKLNNENFLQHADEAAIEKVKQSHAELTHEIQILEMQL
ncbi:MAG: class I tRNA ligase family protein [Clostridia bacterium]|nr:class I tRNA ligase family protein [Clostridia bacterium]